jgi:hypothetical protein
MVLDIPIPTTYSPEGVRWNEENLMSEIAYAVSEHEHRLRQLELTLNELRDTQAIDKYAHLQAFNEIQDRAWQFLLVEIQKATEQTEEYNIPLFTNQMDGALFAHKYDLITIEDDGIPGYITVNIHMELLGTPEQYAKAVGEARKEVSKKPVPDAAIRSKIWQEKIYDVDRKGGKVFRSKKNKKGESEKVDVTERYVGKYTQTIIKRLEKLGDITLAPWWYYINFGNISLEGATDESGIPYPEIYPTNFVEKIKTGIYSAFRDIFYGILDEAERLYTELLKDDYNLKGETKLVDDIIHEQSRYTLEEILELSRYAEGHKTIITLRYNNTVYDLYRTSGGRLGARYNLQQN